MRLVYQSGGLLSTALTRRTNKGEVYFATRVEQLGHSLNSVAPFLTSGLTLTLFLTLGEIIATQRRATPTQRHAKHGSTLKEKLAFLSGTMDFHKPNGSEQIQFFPNIPENIFGNDQREFHQYRMKKNYFRSRRCV